VSADLTVGPYVGLRPYEVDEADLFFGRKTETQDLTSLALGNRLVVVYGHSGSGKTSLLRAGFIAGLRTDESSVLPIGRAVHTSAFPTASAPDYNPFTYALLSSWAPHLPAHAIRGLTIHEFLHGLDAEHDRYGAALPLVAVIDQFEEVFGDTPLWSVQRMEFIEELALAMRRVDRMHLLISMNESALGELLPHEARLSGGDRSYYRVLPLERDAALEAVTEPLAATGRSFAPGVAEELIDRLRTTPIIDALGYEWTKVEGAVEPANLQVVCSALWRGLPDGVTTITQRHVEAYADVEATLGSLCAEAVADVARLEGISESVLWDWLADTLITDLGTRGTAYEGRGTTGGLPHSVARAFEKRWILRSEKRLGSVWFELQHDGLIGPIQRRGRPTGVVHVLDSTDRTASTLLRMAETALAEGMFSLAQQYATDAVAGSADDVLTLAEAHSLLGEIFLQQAQDATGDRAEQLFREAAEHYAAAMELYQARDNTTAVARVLAVLGRLERIRGHMAEALDLLQSALERRRGDPDLYVELAQVSEASGQHLAALGHYSKALDLASENIDALVGRGAVYAERGDAAAALADLEKAIRLEPGTALRPDVVHTRRRAIALLEAAS